MQNRNNRLTARTPMNWRRAGRTQVGGKCFWDPSLSKVRWLYHFIPWGFAVSIFKTRRLRLSPVRSWPDPYEKWWCQLLFDESRPMADVAAYGLCWTRTSFDEPSWRMAGFNRAEPIVRIKCDIQSIQRASYQAIADTPASVFLGAVNYKRQDDLLRNARHVSSASLKEVSHKAAEFLLMKRNAFRFEREVRLLWLDRANNHSQERFVPIDPKHDICQVMMSPHATMEQSALIRQEWLRLGVGVPLVRSGILRAPDFEDGAIA